MKIGILRETTRYFDRRVAIVPQHARLLLDRFPQLTIQIQPSEIRAFKNKEYRNAGIDVAENLNDCDLLIGVKEVDIASIIPEKNYLFFAHVAKQQAYHRNYFRQLARKKITLLDFEYFKTAEGKRITAFGYWAGVVGAYNAISAIGKRYDLFNIPPAESVHDYRQLIAILKEVKLPDQKILLTGNGNTAKGVCAVFDEMKIRKVTEQDYLRNEFEETVYCQITSENYASTEADMYDKTEFYKSPNGYKSRFANYTKATDVFIACHYWNQAAPKFFTLKEMKSADFNIKIIADISCDVNGPIPCTIRESSHEKPFYDFNPKTQKEEPPFSRPKNISIMAIDNLPAAIPKEASTEFSKALCNEIIPLLVLQPSHAIIEGATILEAGKLTSAFSYLSNFLKS